MLIPDVFPGRDPALEDLVQKYNRAKAAEKKAKLAVTARYDAIKSHMENVGLPVYMCYDIRKMVDMRPDDPAVRIKDVPEDRPSPYRPSVEAPASEETEGATEAA
jgi:hypothetical protein